VHRALGVDADDLHRTVGDLLEVPAGARDGAAGADARDEVGDLAVGVVPDLRAGGLVVARRATRVGVLVGLPAAGELAGETIGDAVVAVGVLRRDGGRAHDHLGAVGPQHVALVLADLVGTHEHALVAALLRDQGQADAGVTGGGLDDRPTRLQFARGFGRIDHLHRDAVLGAAAGIEVFDLRRYEP